MSDYEPAKPILNGWKQIAAYLDRGVRTVQRWEVELGLPVRRPHGKFKSTVLALPSELDAWIATAPQLITREDGHTPEAPSGESAQKDQASLRVMVIEDSVRDVSTCVNVLRKLGAAEVDVASNVSAALLHFEEVVAGKLLPPDLIILDLAFARDSGFEVMRYWRARPLLSRIPLVVWTAISPSQQRICLHLGAREVVPKRGGAAELERVLTSGMNGHFRVA